MMHELNLKSTQIEDDRVQPVHVGFTGIAPGGADLAQSKRTSKQAAQILLERRCQNKFVAAQDQLLPPPRGEPTIGRVEDRLLVAQGRAFPAKQATAKVQGLLS